MTEHLDHHDDEDNGRTECCGALFYDPGWPDCDICSQCKEHSAPWREPDAPTTAMSDTPRTDAVDEKFYSAPNSIRYGEMLNHAEQLERETIRQQAEVDTMIDVADKLRAEIAELRLACRGAVQIMGGRLQDGELGPTEQLLWESVLEGAYPAKHLTPPAQPLP